MITAPVDGYYYKYWFRHDRYKSPKQVTFGNRVGVVDIRATTTVYVHRNKIGQKSYTDAANLMAMGFSHCSVKDTFVKETGRVVALRRLMDGISDKRVREAIMKSYFGRERKQ